MEKRYMLIYLIIILFIVPTRFDIKVFVKIQENFRKIILSVRNSNIINFSFNWKFSLGPIDVL